MKIKPVVLAVLFGFGTLCVVFICSPQSYRSRLDYLSADEKPQSSQSAFGPSQVANTWRSDDADAWRGSGRGGHAVSTNASFDPRGRDSLVFIHIPKTGGSNFLSHLVTVERDEDPLCFDSIPTQSGRKKERAFCPRRRGARYGSPSAMPWLISEKTLGWHCGLHPFYSEYKSCISSELKAPKSDSVFDPTCNFHFSTILRHPILRYISEYLHVQRGATFSYRHICGQRQVTDHEMPPCYPGYYNHQSWNNVTLSMFLSCESNWANNRQTFSIADLETVHCFNKRAMPQQEREQMLLESAKENLRRFPFFGLTEYQVESSLLFEHTFGLRFTDKLGQRPVSELNSAPMLNTLWNTPSTYDKIAAANNLDMQLYEYALELFNSRLKAIDIAIDPSKVTADIKLLPTNAASYAKLKYRRLNFNLEER